MKFVVKASTLLSCLLTISPLEVASSGGLEEEESKVFIEGDDTDLSTSKQNQPGTLHNVDNNNNNNNNNNEFPPPPHRRMAKLYDDGQYIYSKIATIPPLIDHPFPDEGTKQSTAESFGHWHFEDTKDETKRPSNDYMANFAHRDIPSDKFPKDAWQTDTEFLNHYLNDAEQLVTRAMEAIYTEYGYGKPLSPEDEERRTKMFGWEMYNMTSGDKKGPQGFSGHKGTRGTGGWTTQRSFDGLVRRILHALMTSDTFTVVMGGHSASAGEGNHFRQSYMMQFHKVMYPVFARLGVKLITRNIGMGGLGTAHNAMGSGSIYGSEVDILMWDSAMTELPKGSSDLIDLFMKQGLIGGNRVPVIWGAPFKILKPIHENADADVGEWGSAGDYIPVVTGLEQAKSIPYAARYMRCSEEAKPFCQAEPKYCAKCWVDREDGIVPDRTQRNSPKGQVGWHPGWRQHQLMGRNLAMAVLQALEAAINKWNEGVADGTPLDDDVWHVKDYYEKIRTKVANLETGPCYEIAEKRGLPRRLCNTPMKARTQYTPRADYHKSSLTSIIKPASDGYVPKNENVALYDGPDAHNSCFDIPEGEIDVFNVVVGRRQLADEKGSIAWTATSNIKISAMTPAEKKSSKTDDKVNTRGLAGEKIVPGKGWEISGEPQGYCDGTYNSVCSRSTNEECILTGRQAGRGAVIGNEYSGWLVFKLEDLKEGLILLKLFTMLPEENSKRTEGWTSVNNEPIEKRMLRDGKHSSREDAAETKELGSEAKQEDGHRRLGGKQENLDDLPESFRFEYAIDGEITSLDNGQLKERLHGVERLTTVITLLDDPIFSSKKKTVEVAIRLVGTERKVVFGVSHIYWA